MFPRARRLIITLASLVALAAALTACSTGGAVKPTISDPWARPSVGSDKPVAAYMTITNGGSQADRLVRASSPLAGKVEIHETTTEGGMTGMQPVEAIEIPAGGTVRLEPGGFHLMIMELSQPLAVGDTLELELVFERAGPITVEADVREG
jgi:copper(I)-binding protein